MSEQEEPTTANEFSGQAHTVVQAGTTGHVQIVHEGHAVIGDVYGGLHWGGSTPPAPQQDGQETP